MSARAKPKNKLPAVRKELTLNAPDEESGIREYAKLMSSPELASARVIIATEGSQGPGANLDTPALVERLRGQATAIQSGDRALIESMLMNQAVSLQSLFAKLIERGMQSELMAHYEAHLRLALRAQAQCTRTLETLATIKNPPMVFAQQANIAQQQQVNNGVARDPLQAHNGDFLQNKLLECLPSERLDSRTTATPSGTYSELATVESVHRPEVGSR
jgi:hypothetical protein